MAVNHDPRCKQCRREGVKLFLKGDKCFTKCTLDKMSRDGKTKLRDKPPGQQGAPTYQKKMTEYGTQLREKQKMRRIYRVLELQFRNYLTEAMRRPGVTGENLFQLLEIRLDNVIYRLGLASSRAQARQLVSHRFYTVNGKRVNIPSYLLKPGDIIGVHESKSAAGITKETRDRLHTRRTVPTWLDISRDTLEGRVVAIPSLMDIKTQYDVRDIKENLIIEFYSR